MVRTRSQHGENTSGRLRSSALRLITAILCAGCANPGPPKPPSLHLPALVKDLSAERVGDHVILRWTTPSRTTDDQEIKGALTAEACRETDPKPTTPAAKLTACAPLGHISVNSGLSETTDTLPATLQTGPTLRLAYRIQVFNSTGHSAGESAMPAFAASGTAPAPVDSLRATSTEQGAILEWRSGVSFQDVDQIDFKRIDLTVAAPTPKTPKPAPTPTHPAGKNKSSQTNKSSQPKKAAAQPADEVNLKATDKPANPSTTTAGTVDTTAAMGHTYNYFAQRVRTVTLNGQPLEIKSDPSPVVTLVMRDTFPPKTPTGLETISGVAAPDASVAGTPGNPYIDLSWEPNSEADLAGYRVYRQLARPDGSPQGPLARLTELPIAAPAYRDVAVKPGQGYIYSVTAVDAAGNESAPSAKALEVVSPN